MIRHVKYRDIDVSEYEARSEVINRFLDTHALEVMGRFYLKTARRPGPVVRFSPVTGDNLEAKPL